MSLAKCLIDFPVDAEDLAEIRKLMGKGGDEAKAVEAFSKQLDKDLDGLREQLAKNGHNVDRPAAAQPKAEPSRPATVLPELAREVEAAKREGFDPTTGEHDLGDDVAGLREQGAISAEDEAFLKVADENFAAAAAWEDVMHVARTCVRPS